MVRETRYLLVGNLPEKVSEDAVLDHFKRFGKIQSVKLHKKDSDEGISATVAFGDIKSASKAHGSENRIEGNLLTTEYSEGSVSGSAVTRIVEPSPVRSAGYSRQFTARSKGSEEGEGFENRDFHYSPGQYEGRYSQGSYGEEGYQRGRPRERFLGRGAFKQYDVRGGYHGRPSTYKAFDQSSQDGFEKPKVPQSPAHSTSHSSSRHSSKRKKKKKHVSRSHSRSRSRSSSSSSSSRSSSESSGSRSSSGSSHSTLHRRRSQTSVGNIKSYRTESQDSIGSDQGGGKADLDKSRGLLVKNLPLRSSDTSLRDGLFHDFKKYGKINAVLVTGAGDERYAIVSYRKTEDAEKALQNTQGKVFFGMKIKTSLTDGIEVDDNELRPPEAELDEHHPKATRTLFVGNLEKDISNEELRERFSKYGTILDIDVKRQGAVSAYAFVQFTDISSVVKVLRELEGETWGSMKLKLGFGKSMPTTCVWLDNVDQTVQENFLCRQFMRYGQVTHGIIDRIRGRALVYFVNLEMAQYALTEMRNRILNNRKIIIDFASRDCQTEFYEKMEKTGQLKPGMRPDERRGWMYNRQGPDGQWEATYDNRGSFYKFPYHQGGPPPFRGRGRGMMWGSRGGFTGEEYRRTRSYEDYSRYPGGPPDGDFDQDLRAYQRERREHGSPSPSQYSDDPYGERYGKGYYKYPESYRSGSPVSERAYEEFEYGKPRPDEKYFRERYPEVEFHERRGYSPGNRSWSRSPTLGMPPKESYGRNTPPTPMDDEMHDFSSHDNSPEEEHHGKYSDSKEKRRKSGDDFMINEADIAEINRASKYRKGQESPWREERYDRKRSYDESFSHDLGPYEQSPHKLDRQLSRGSKSSIADSKRDLYQKVQKIQSKISERLKKGKNESSPSSGSSESGELTEGELSKLQSEKQLLLDKLKSLEKDSSNSDLEEGMIEEDKRKTSKRPRLESDLMWEKSKSEQMNAKEHPKKSLSYDSSQSLRKQMDHLRKIDETKRMEEKSKAYASNAARTSLDNEGSEIDEFSAMLSPKDLSASFKKRKKYETSDEKRSYRLKRGEEELSSDNEDGKNLSRMDSLSSNPVFRRMSSGHSSPRTPVIPPGQEIPGDVHRHSESDLSAGESHTSINTEESSKKKTDHGSKVQGHRSKHRHKEEHQPTIIPLGDDDPHTDMIDPRSRILHSEQISLPLPQFAELDLNVMMSPEDERMKSESPCFSPPSSGSKNTNSPQRSPSESVSADSQEAPQPEYIPDGGTTEVPSEDQLLGKTKEKSEFDSDDGLSDTSDHLETSMFDPDDKLTLEERIRRLDEKLNAVPTSTTSTKPVSDISSPLSINSGAKGESCNSTLTRTALYSKYRISKRQDMSGNGVESKPDGSDIAQTIVSRKISIFDQDAKRLEQISEKYSPKTNNPSTDDTHISMPVMTKAAVKEMPLATLPQSLTGRLGNSAAFPTLSVNTTTANQTVLKPDEMFSSPASEISTPSPAFSSTQEKPLWQTENSTGSPKLTEPPVTAYLTVPKSNLSEQSSVSGSVHSNYNKEEIVHKPFITPAVKKQIGLPNPVEDSSVLTNSVILEEKYHSPRELEKVSPKVENKISPQKNEPSSSPKSSPKSSLLSDSITCTSHASVETKSLTNLDPRSNCTANDVKSAAGCEKSNTSGANEPMDLDSGSAVCDSNSISNNADSSESLNTAEKLTNHVSESQSEKLTESRDEKNVSSKSNDVSNSVTQVKEVKQNTNSSSSGNSDSKLNSAKEHANKHSESVEDILGLNSPVVLGKRKAESDESTKSHSVPKEKSDTKDLNKEDHVSTEAETVEKEEKSQGPDPKKAKLSKSESSSSEAEKSDSSKNKVKSKDSHKKEKESKKKGGCDGDAVKKEKNNGEKKDKDKDGNSGKGSLSKSSSTEKSSSEKTGSEKAGSGKSATKTPEKPVSGSKPSSKPEDKSSKSGSDKSKSHKSEDKSKTQPGSGSTPSKSESKTKPDDKSKTEKTSSDGTVKKPSEKKSEHKKEHKSSSSSKPSDPTKTKEKSTKEDVKGKPKDEQNSSSKASKTEKSGHVSSEKSTKDGLNKLKKDTGSEKSKSESCKPKDEQKERSPSFDSPSKSKDSSQSDAKPVMEAEKVKEKSPTHPAEGSKTTDSKTSSEKDKSTKHNSSIVRSGEKSKSKDHSKTKVKDKQPSMDKSSKDDGKEKPVMKAEETSEKRSEKSEQKSGNGDSKSEQKGDSSESKSGDGDKSSDKGSDKGSENKSGNSDGKLEMKDFGSDERKHEKKKSSHSDPSKQSKKSEKSEKNGESKLPKTSSQKLSVKSDSDKISKSDHEKSKNNKSHSDKPKKSSSSSGEKVKKAEKENKEVKSSSSSKKKDKSDDSFDSMKSPDRSKKPVEDDFDWDAWQEPYVSMYDKVKRRSTIKDQERERERELEKTRERLDRLQEKRQNKKASKQQKVGKTSFRSDYTESDFSDDEGKSKKKSTLQSSNKKKASQIYSSSSESDYDFEEPLFPNQKKAQVKTKVQPIPKKKKKASILDIYSSDSDESSDSSFGIPASVNKKKSKLHKQDHHSIERDDVFGLKNKPLDIKKKSKKEVSHKVVEQKSPIRKSLTEIFSSSGSDSDTDPAIQESPKPVQRSKSLKDNHKGDKIVNKIYSSSDSDSMDEMFSPPKKILFPENSKDKSIKKAKTPKKQDNNNKKPNNLHEDSRTFKGLVTTQTVLEKDIPVSCKGESLFDRMDSISESHKKEKTSKNIKKKERDENVVKDGQAEKSSQGLFEKMGSYTSPQKDVKEISMYDEIKLASNKNKSTSSINSKDLCTGAEKPKKKKDSKKKRDSIGEKRMDKTSGSISSSTASVSNLEEGIVFGDNEKVEDNVIVEEIPIEDSFLVEAPVQDDNARTMWDSGEEVVPKSLADKENHSSDKNITMEGLSGDKSGKSAKSNKIKDKTEGDEAKKSKKKDKVDMDGKPKKRRKKTKSSSSDMDKTIDDVSKGKDLLSSAETEVEQKGKETTDGASSDHSDVDLDFSTPLFGNFVPAVIKPARPSLKEKDKAVSDKNEKDAEKVEIGTDKDQEEKDTAASKKEGEHHREEKAVDLAEQEKQQSEVCAKKPSEEKDADSMQKPQVLEKIGTDVMEREKSSESDAKSEVSPTKAHLSPKDGLSVLPTNKLGSGLLSLTNHMPGLLSPPISKNATLLPPNTQPSAILKSQTSQPNKHKPSTKPGIEDLCRKSGSQKANSSLKKTKGSDVFEFKEDDSDVVEPLNYKHRLGEGEKAKVCGENKSNPLHNDIAAKSDNGQQRPKEGNKPGLTWEMPWLDKNNKRDGESKPRTGVHHEQESLFANWAKSLTEVKNKPNPFTVDKNIMDSLKGVNKKQPRKVKQPQKQPTKSPFKNDNMSSQPPKAADEKEGKGSTEDLARDDFGFGLLAEEGEKNKVDKTVKEKSLPPKDRIEETLEAVSSLQSLADISDKDKDQLSEDDALVIDESVNTAGPETSQEPSSAPENVPQQADNETALAIQSILSFEEEKPQEQEIAAPSAEETEVNRAVEQISSEVPVSDVPTHTQVPEPPVQTPLSESKTPLVPSKVTPSVYDDVSRSSIHEPHLEQLPRISQEQSLFTGLPFSENTPVLNSSGKAKKPKAGKKKRSGKSPVQGPAQPSIPAVEDSFDLQSRDDSDDGALHIATESPNPEPPESHDVGAEVLHPAVDSALQQPQVDPHPKVLSPLHISLNGASFEKPERQSRSRRKKNAKTPEVQPPISDISSKDGEIETMSDFGSPNRTTEKTDLSISDSERTDDGDASFGDEEGKRPRRGGRKKNYKALSGITPRTNSPRSRTSPRSPRGASPKTDIASPVVKIERLPNVGKTQGKEEDMEAVKDQPGKEVAAVRDSMLKDASPAKDGPRRGRSAVLSDMVENSVQPAQKATNVFDFDASEAEEKNESAPPAPISKRRSTNRRKKGSSEGLDGTVLTSEIKETGIKLSIARAPIGLSRNNSQEQPKDKGADGKKTVSPNAENKAAKDIIPVMPPVEPEKKAMKPRDMMNAEGRSRSNSLAREEPISITIPKSKIIPSLPATSVAIPPATQPITPATPMSNIDRIIDNVSKGIFDWNDADEHVTKPLSVDVGHIDKKKAASRNHGDDLHMKSPQLVSPVINHHGGGMKSPCTTMSVVSPLTGGQQMMPNMKSPHIDHQKAGLALHSPVIPTTQGSFDLAHGRAGFEDGGRMMAPPTATSSPIQSQPSAIVTLANKFDSHLNHMHMSARFPPPISAHAANTTVVMTTSNSPLVSTGMTPASHYEMVLNMSKNAPSSVAMTTASAVSVATTVLSTAGNTRSVIASSHSQQQQHQQPNTSAPAKFQQPEPITTSAPPASVGEKRSNSLDRLQQTVTSAPTCVVHPITTTSLTSKQQQAAQAAQMMHLGIPEPRLNQMQALLHADPKALDGLSKEQFLAIMESRVPFMHPIADQHVIQQIVTQKNMLEMQKHPEMMKATKGRGSQKNQDHGKESQRPPSAHSNPKQGGTPADRLPFEQFGFPPMAFQDQIRAQMKMYPPQMLAHLQHLQQMKQLEEKKLHADPKTTSPNLLHQPSSVIAATVASQHGQHPQIKSPALAQTAPSPHQVGPTFTQALSLQRPPSPVKKHADKLPHGNRWSEGNNIPAHEGQRSRPPSHDAERTSPHDHWVYGQAPKPAHQHHLPDQIPMSQKERLMQRQKEDQQRELEMQREKEKKQQELQWQQQIEERVRQEVMPAHSQGRREAQGQGSSALASQPTDLRQTALVPGQQRLPGQSEKEMVDPRFSQHPPGMNYPTDLRRPSSQNPAGFPPSGAEISPGVPAHLNPEMQRLYQERILAMGHPMQMDPLHMRQLLASGINPHYLAPRGLPVDHPGLTEGRPPSQSSHQGESSRGHGPGGKLPGSDGPMLHIHDNPMHGMPGRPIHDGPPGGEGSLLSSLQRYPVMWQGVLALKNDQCVVQLHLINGFNQLVKMSLPQTSPDGTVQPLRISQRMRLEAAQLEGVIKRMQFDKDYCMLLALPCGRDHEDIISQTRAMASGFIQYLQQKQAAGIVNVPEPETQQPAYVVHIFPPCEFSHNTLGRLGFDLLHQVRDLAHLLVIITTVA